MNCNTKSRPKSARLRRVRAGLVSAATVAVTLLASGAYAQNAPNTNNSQNGAPQGNNAPRNTAPAPPAATAAMERKNPLTRDTVESLPTSVLLFKPVVTAGAAVAPETTSTRDAQLLVGAALEQYLTKGGVGVTMYSWRIPSMQRAISEGTVKKEDAEKGPGDDSRTALKYSSLVGGAEFLMASIDDYKYDRETRRATFTLTITRSGADGIVLNTTALPAVGEAPADVAPSRQEGSAVARAAEVVAEQTVRALYPMTAPQLDPPKPKKEKRRKSTLGWIIPAAAVGAALIIPR